MRFITTRTGTRKLSKSIGYIWKKKVRRKNKKSSQIEISDDGRNDDQSRASSQSANSPQREPSSTPPPEGRHSIFNESLFPANNSADFSDEDAETDAHLHSHRHPMATRRLSRVAVVKSQQTSSSQASREASMEPSPPSYSPDNVDKFNSLVVAKDSSHKRLLKLNSKSGNKKYYMRAQDDPDERVIDDRVDVEVRDRSDEGWPKWDKQWTDSGKASNDFEIDFIVCTTPRKIGERLKMDNKCKSLIKFTNFPLPSWELNSKIDTRRTIAVGAFEERLLDLDFIEVRLKLTLGPADFLKLYPNRYLAEEKGDGCGGYIRNPRARYFNRLRAIEWRWNYVCARAGLPHLYIEDWTNEKENDEPLWNLEFICHLIMSPEVKVLLKGMNQLKNVKCTDNCKRCARVERHGEIKHCCNIRKSMNVQGDGTVDWVDDGQAKNMPWLDFECSEDCGCGSACENRRLQKGRQMPLCIFREPTTGWGVRCVTEIPKDSFITEYAGEVRKEVTKEGPGQNNYNFEMMRHGKATTRDGKPIPTPLNIDAKKKGNEARFFAHSCAPNMNGVSLVVERFGLFYHHVAFIANRRIFPGEELCFKYFNDSDMKEMIEKMFKMCSCGSARCAKPAPKKSMQSLGSSLDESKQIRKRRASEELEEEDEEWKSPRESEEVESGRFDMSGFDYDDEEPGPSTRRRRRVRVWSPSVDGNTKRGVKRSMDDEKEERGKKDNKKRKEGDEREERIEKMKGLDAAKKRDEEEKAKKKEEKEKKGKKEENKVAKTCSDERRSGGMAKKRVQMRPPLPSTPGPVAREPSIDPNRLCTRATGVGRRPVTRYGRVVNWEEEQEDLERRMASSPPTTSAPPAIPSSHRSSLPSCSKSGQKDGDQDSSSSEDCRRRD